MPDRPNFPIPDELTPETFCLCLQIPNNPIWKQVFAGLLAEPIYWFNWQRDADHSGKTVSQYWQTLYDQIDWSDMSCCCDQPPAIYRYNSDGVYQRSTDGGATWTNAPGYDYRNTSTVFPPPSAIGITNTKCQAADGVVFTINDEIVQALDESFAAAQILALIAAVLLAILSAGSLAALTPLITAIGSAIIDVGVTATQAAFTTAVKNRLRCNIFSHMTTDDDIDQAGFEAVLAQITTDESGIAETILYGIVNAAGRVGIVNMLRSNKGDPDADCSDCEPCIGFDMSLWDTDQLGHDPNYGTIDPTTRTCNQVDIVAVSAGGVYRVQWQGTGASDCVLGLGHGALSGAYDTTQTYIKLCGTALSAAYSIQNNSFAVQCVNSIILQSGSPFTVRITSDTAVAC